MTRVSLPRCKCGHSASRHWHTEDLVIENCGICDCVSYTNNEVERRRMLERELKQAEQTIAALQDRCVRLSNELIKMGRAVEIDAAIADEVET